jgi:DNA-binding response OmpR family regulator
MVYPQTLQRCHETIAKLEAKIEALQDILSYADTDQGAPIRYPIDPARVKYGLGEREAFLLSLLTADKVTSSAWIQDQMGSTSPKSIPTIMSNLRKKLAKHGIKIINCHGVGYRLEGV